MATKIVSTKLARPSQHRRHKNNTNHVKLTEEARIRLKIAREILKNLTSESDNKNSVFLA